MFTHRPSIDVSRGKDRADSSVSSGFSAWDILFALLLALNIARALRHAMWRDELQMFQLGSGSPTLIDLFRNLKYQSHAGLWDTLVWGVSRLTPDPAWMQVLHAAIATGVWIVVWRWSPFSRLEKLLLLLSYALFFEYFVISRGYVLVVLLAFVFVTLRQLRPAPVLLCWLLLGLMAHFVVHAAIWSIALAVVFVLEERRWDVRFVAGAALYLALLAAGIATMIPAPDFAPWLTSPRFDWPVVYAPTVMFGAFVPFEPRWLDAAARFLSEPTEAGFPFILNPNPVDAFLSFTQAGPDHPARLGALLLTPIAVCLVLTRNGFRLMEFSLLYVGVLLFAVLWHFPGGSRHTGLVFLALVACVWTARSRGSVTGPSWLFGGILAANALGGALTLSSELYPYSQSRNTAAWIKESGLARMPLVGSRDAQVSSVAGYLGRPVYYLECECVGTFIVWNRSRQSPLSDEQFRERLNRAFDHAGQSEVILIRNAPVTADQEERMPSGISLKLLKSFTGAAVDENYWIYRANRITI